VAVQSDGKIVVAGSSSFGAGTISFALVRYTSTGALGQFEFIRRKGSGLIYAPQKSTTLAPGSFVAMTGAMTVQNLGADCERVIILEPLHLATTPNFFSRLQVILPP